MKLIQHLGFLDAASEGLAICQNCKKLSARPQVTRAILQMASLEPRHGEATATAMDVPGVRVCVCVHARTLTYKRCDDGVDTTVLR